MKFRKFPDSILNMLLQQNVIRIYFLFFLIFSYLCAHNLLGAELFVENSLLCYIFFLLLSIPNRHFKAIHKSHCINVENNFQNILTVIRIRYSIEHVTNGNSLDFLSNLAYIKEVNIIMQTKALSALNDPSK